MRQLRIRARELQPGDVIVEQFSRNWKVLWVKVDHPHLIATCDWSESPQRTIRYIMSPSRRITVQR